jgi:hypothetical protein
MKKHNGHVLEIATEEGCTSEGSHFLKADIDAACDRFWEKRGRNKYGYTGEVLPFSKKCGTNKQKGL